VEATLVPGRIRPITFSGALVEERAFAFHEGLSCQGQVKVRRHVAQGVSIKVRRSDSYKRERLVVDVKDAANHRGIEPVDLLPQTIAHKRGRRSGGGIIRDGECTSRISVQTEHGKIVARDKLTEIGFRRVCAVRVPNPKEGPSGLERRQFFEVFRVCAKVFVEFVGNDCVVAGTTETQPHTAIRILAQAVELSWIGDGQRSQQNCLNQREDRSSGTDAEGEGQEGNGGEGGVLSELPDSVAVIGDHGMEPSANPFFANLLFHLFDAAEFDPRGALRFLQRHACANVFLRQHFEVGTNLLVEVYLSPAR
jgi:hypothetical protein